MKKILVVSPHPDDAEIGCGAAIYDWGRHGHQIDIAVCTGQGDLTMVHSGECIPFEKRMEEQGKAAALLGATARFLEFAPASKFDTRPISLLVTLFDDLFKAYDTVILPLPSAAKDHQIVWEAGMAAFRQGKLDGVTCYAYEQPMQHHGATPPATGQVYIPLTEKAVEVKLRAIEQHQSQFGSRKGWGLYAPETIVAMAKLRGAENGAQYAEMIYLIRGRYENIV